MGRRALGSLDQRKIVDRAMGEGSYTVEIYVNNIICVGGVSGHAFRGNCTSTCHYGERKARQGPNLGTYSHGGASDLLSFNTRISPHSAPGNDNKLGSANLRASVKGDQRISYQPRRSAPTDTGYKERGEEFWDEAPTTSLHRRTRPRG
jgi:hypothetical protein